MSSKKQGPSRHAAIPGLPAVLLGAVFLALVLAPGLWFVLRTPNGPASPEGIDIAGLAARLREAERRFPGDDPDRPLAFPADHGAHPRAPAEVWDFAGWLRDSEGRDFAFRLSFARLGWRPDSPQRPSAWAAAAAHRGWFALADGSRGSFHGTERFQRAALGLSGFDAAGGRLWLDDWSMRVRPDDTAGFILRAGTRGTGIDLRLAGLKPAVASDAAGFPGGGGVRAYVQSRLDVSGTLEAGGRLRPVTGSAWLGRTWGRWLPPGGQVALDRYQVQLDDGRELLILRLRRRDGSAEPLDRGILIGADGRTEALGREEIRLEPVGWWLSPDSRVRYPVRWILRLPPPGTELRLSPLVENQEIRGTLRAWSGAVRVEGTTTGNRPVSGVGFVDLSGY